MSGTTFVNEVLSIAERLAGVEVPQLIYRSPAGLTWASLHLPRGEVSDKVVSILQDARARKAAVIATARCTQGPNLDAEQLVVVLIERGRVRVWRATQAAGSLGPLMEANAVAAGGWLVETLRRGTRRRQRPSAPTSEPS